MDDLTVAERRLVLAALWAFRLELEKSVDAVSALADIDLDHEEATMEALATAARKLGGTPDKTTFGARDL